LKLDVGVDFALCPTTACADQFIDGDALGLELKIT